MERTPIVIDPRQFHEEFKEEKQGHFFLETYWRTWALGIMFAFEKNDPHWIGLKIGPWCFGVQWGEWK